MGHVGFRVGRRIRSARPYVADDADHFAPGAGALEPGGHPASDDRGRRLARPQFPRQCLVDDDDRRRLRRCSRRRKSSGDRTEHRLWRSNLASLRALPPAVILQAGSRAQARGPDH